MKTGFFLAVMRPLSDIGDGRMAPHDKTVGE